MSWNGRGSGGLSVKPCPPLLHPTKYIGRPSRPACENMPVTQCADPRHKRPQRQAFRSPIALSKKFETPATTVSAARHSAALPRSWRGGVWQKASRRAHLLWFAARRCARAVSLCRTEAGWRATRIWHADCFPVPSLLPSQIPMLPHHTPAPGVSHGSPPSKSAAATPRVVVV